MNTFNLTIINPHGNFIEVDIPNEKGALSLAEEIAFMRYAESFTSETPEKLKQIMTMHMIERNKTFPHFKCLCGKKKKHKE